MDNIKKLIEQNKALSEELTICANPKSIRSLNHMQNVMQSAAQALEYTTGYLAGLTDKESKRNVK